MLLEYAMKNGAVHLKNKKWLCLDLDATQGQMATFTPCDPNATWPKMSTIPDLHL